MGMGKDFSSADDTDTDCLLDVKFDEHVKIDSKESVYWADEEQQDELDSFDSELDRNDIWKCIRLAWSLNM